MLKKLVIGCMVGAAVLMTPVAGMHERVQEASAAEVCSSDDECAERVREARETLQTLDQEEAAVQEDLSDVELDITLTLEQIAEKEAAIAQVQIEIDDLEQNIQENEEELAILDLEIAQLQETIGRRMRLSQRMNNSNVFLDILSDSESFVDFIRRVRIVTHLSVSDAEIMEEFTTLVDQQQEILATLQSQISDLDEKVYDLEEDTKALETIREELVEKQSALTQRIRAIESERLSAQDIIDIASQQTAAVDVGTVQEVSVPSGRGKFIIPMARGVVTCEWMCYTQHTGIDLSSSNRAEPILAAAAGTVAIAGWHNAFGNYIVITHNINGQTFTTLYAHLSAIHVSVGQSVAQGQHIGNMGNTGNSTGPHLHFEIYVGTFNWPHARNPRDFIQFPPRGVWW